MESNATKVRLPTSRRTYLRYILAAIVAAILGVLSFGKGVGIPAFLLSGLLYSGVVAVAISSAAPELRRQVRRREVWMFTLAHFVFGVTYLVVLAMLNAQNVDERGYRLRYEWAPIMVLIQPMIYLIELAIILGAGAGLRRLRGSRSQRNLR